MEGVAKKKHSKLGIVSCCIWLFAMILLVLSVLGDFQEINGYFILATVLLSLFLQICAFTLGVGGLFQQDRKKAFPILGIVFSFFGFWWDFNAVSIFIGNYLMRNGYLY